LRENESGIFLSPGLDTISENQKLFAVVLICRCYASKIALARKANQFAGSIPHERSDMRESGK
jgi:hypothetical protein